VLDTAKHWCKTHAYNHKVDKIDLSSSGDREPLQWNIYTNSPKLSILVGEACSKQQAIMHVVVVSIIIIADTENVRRTAEQRQHNRSVPPAAVSPASCPRRLALARLSY
jgi:hypothetical protein